MRKLISIILFVTVVLTVGNPVNPVNVRALEEVTFPMPLICIDFENMQHTTPFAEIKDAVYGEETQSCHKFWNLVTDGKISVVREIMMDWSGPELQSPSSTMQPKARHGQMKESVNLSHGG